MALNRRKHNMEFIMKINARSKMIIKFPQCTIIFQINEKKLWSNSIRILIAHINICFRGKQLFSFKM